MLRGIFGSGGGAAIGGGGTSSPSTIPRWTGPSTLGDSGLIDDGSVIYTTARNAAFGSTSSAGYRARVLAAAGAGSAFGLRIDAGTNSTDYALRIANQATTSDYLAVRGDGNVGIGTANPNAPLQVLRSGAVEVRTTTSSNTVSNTITHRFSSSAGAGAFEGGGAYVQAVQGSGVDSWSLAFGTANASATATERARIDSVGNFGIGTAGAAANTPAANGSLVIGQNNVSQQWAARIYGGNDANRAPVLSLFRAGNTEGIIAEIKNGAVGALALGITGGVANFNDATLSAACQVQITSTLMDISGSGYGLKLPATPGNGDAQTLDCYAEVAWTPADVSGAGLTITVNRATYTKIGRTVTASFDISYPVTANGAAAQISLPESTGTANLGTLSAPFCSSSTSTAGLTGIVTNGRIVFYYGIPSANVPNSVFSGARIVASVTFTV